MAVPSNAPPGAPAIFYEQHERVKELGSRVRTMERQMRLSVTR